MDVLYLHNNIFLTDIIGYDRLNLVEFIPPQNEILGTILVEVQKCSLFHYSLIISDY